MPYRSEPTTLVVRVVTYEMRGQDFHTSLGIVRGGLPREDVRADIAMIDDDIANGRATVHAARVNVDQKSQGIALEDRELEVVASFSMRDEMFVSTFTRVARQIETARLGRVAPCPCGSGKTFDDCHGRS